jgi:peptide deformylase
MSQMLTIDTKKQAALKTPVRDQFRILTLVPETDTVLKQKLEDFDFTNPPCNPGVLASELVETMKKNVGIGLSANQCGLPYRVFVVGPPDGGDVVAYFNPKIISSSGSQFGPEGCLSFPELFISIERSEEIEVEYQDYQGIVRRQKYTGLTARCFQHELDHLNGIVYTDRAKKLALQQAYKRRKKREAMRVKMTKALSTLEKNKKKGLK